jgi:mycothiol S-conjugate amidase
MNQMQKRLLAVLAHPDDESFGPGGTLAKYTAEGVAVHIAIATDGAVGSVVAEYENDREQLVSIRAEELARAVNILGVTLHKLDYRDSGYLNDPANDHPDAFIKASEYDATGKVVKLIREIRPQVVLTHDEMGGYLHPDHIQCWKITSSAFYAAGDPGQYPELGLEPYQPERLYYTAVSNRWVKFFTFLLKLRRRDPTKFGRNQDVDLTKLGVDPSKITTVIDYRPYWDVKMAAMAEHASQGGGRGGPRMLPVWIQKQFLSKDTFIRAYPEASNGLREEDMFAGINGRI